MLDDAQLKEIELQAADLVRGAGAVLLDYFDRPLAIDYKSANNRNPVTEADHAADDFLRAEIARRFPGHGVVTEETESDDDDAREVTWVVDPLDGTTNFLHGLPVFASMVAALERGRPVAAAIYTPRIGDSEGRILHGRSGGGAYENGSPIVIDNLDPPRRMAAVPGYFLRMFSQHRRLRRRLGDLRTTGSAGFELSMTARGVFDYVVFNGPMVWDLAAGVLLVQEAGGVAYLRNPRTRRWAPFETFALAADHSPRPSELRKWRGAMALGKPPVVEQITSGIAPRSYPIRALQRKVSGLLGRSQPPSAPPPPRLPSP